MSGWDRVGLGLCLAYLIDTWLDALGAMIVR